MRARVAVSAAFVFLTAAGMYAASQPAYSHRVWRIEDGLPQNRIRALTQTPDGYLWIGTSEGLARFDGARFVVFDRSNTPALSDDGILTLRLTSAGDLWIGTEGGGIVRYSHNAFRAFGAAEGLTNGFVRAIYEDRKKILWVGTDRGFFRFDGGRFERLDNTPEIPLASVANIAEDRDGHVLALGSGSLLTVTAGKLARLPQTCAGAPIRALRASPDGALWALHATGASRLVNGCPQPDKSVPQVPIRALVTGREGNLWLGTTAHGLIEIRDGKVIASDALSALPDKTVNVIFEDREGTLWVGCEDGLLRLSRSSVTNIGNSDGLDDDNVVTTYTDRAGRVWLATLTGQIYVVEGRNVSRYRAAGMPPDLTIRTVYEDTRGARWFGTFAGGIIRQAEGKTTAYTRKDGPRSNTVRQILEDRPGNIWFALDSGLSRWDGAAFRNYYLPEGLSYPSTRCLLLEADGDVLVGTDAGLNRIHDGMIVRGNEFAALAKEKIWSIHQDRNGALWIGTRGGGLLRFKGGALARFTRSNGLPSDTIYQILEDDHGKFWMSTSAGVVSALRSELESAAGSPAQLVHVTQFGTADGMATSQMNGGMQPSGSRTPSGDLWFPSVKGAVRVNPAGVPARPMPPVLVERIVSDSQTLPATGEIRIQPGHGRIQVDYTLCDLLRPQSVSFRYKLEGFDENWTPAVRARSASYTNLPPRHYRFRVMALDPASLSNQSEASLEFTLEPAFYQTNWFYSLLVLAAAGLAWGGFSFYARQTRARYNLLLAERTRLAREMHDTVIQGCVGVSTLLEASAGYRRVDPSEADKLVNQARAQVIETLEEAREAVWDLRHSPVSESPVTMLFELARRLGEEHGIQIDTEVAGKATPDAEIDRAILLVGREALRNAIAHAHPTHVKVRLAFYESNVELTVADDGKGFSTSAAGTPESRHFGLIGMRERVEQSGGEYRLESTPGTGTKVTARLPVRANA